jgi:FkbM family methyltransferase
VDEPADTNGDILELPLGREPVAVPRAGHEFARAAMPLLQQLVAPGGAHFRVDASRLTCAIGGITAVVDSVETVWILHEIFLAGVYGLVDRLDPDEQIVVWDIGMNRALTALWFASKSRVAAVVGHEPLAATYRVAQQMLAAHPQLAAKITALDVGVGGSSRTEMVDHSAAFSGSVGLRGLVGDPTRMRAELGIDDLGPITREPMWLREANEALQTVRDAHPGLPVVAKIDCEGAEYEIVAALRRTGALRDLHAVMIEWHGNDGPQPLRDDLEAAGFTVWSDGRGAADGRGMLYALQRRRPAAVVGRPLPGVRVNGSFRGATGHDRHVRGFVRALHERGTAVELHDLPQWSPVRLPAALRDPFHDRLARESGTKRPAVIVHCCMPHQVRRDADALNVNYTMFEASRIPARWAELAREHPGDLVVVPTESSRRAWLASGVPEQQLRVSPLGVDPAFAAAAAPLELRDAGESLAERRVRFLNVSAPGTRKNLEGLIRTWLVATRASDDAVLVLKLLAASPRVVERFRARVEAIERAVGRSLAAAAPVHLVTDVLPDRAMPRLHAAATHYISLSFGEGWDLPMVEAAASGLRLIAPAHSAYLDYLDPSVATLLPARAVPAIVEGPAELQALFAGAHWWRPDEDAAAAAIRSAIAGRDAPAASARDRVLGEYSMAQAVDRLADVIAVAAS